MNGLRAVFAYRGYVWRNAVNEVRYRYAGSGMGVFWNVINPALQVVLFGVLFGLAQIPQDLTGRERWLHLCLGLLPWLGFAETLARVSLAFVRSAGLLRVTNVPLEVLVAESTLASALGAQLAVGVLLVAAVASGVALHPRLLLLPLAVALLHAFAFGLGLLLASWRAFFADTSEVLRVVTQLWMWTMPIAYPEALVPAALRPWLGLNPPWVYLQQIRALGLGQTDLDPSSWLLMFGWPIVSCAVGLLVVQRLRSQVLDVA
ncbi:MAG: ABC transporter permease [Vicinamibacteria bacterium]|nr:ABC transporter permease [Vicinamibacteria bacterium]